VRHGALASMMLSPVIGLMTYATALLTAFSIAQRRASCPFYGLTYLVKGHTHDHEIGLLGPSLRRLLLSLRCTSHYSTERCYRSLR
jgi:hypothetical protein